VAENSLVLDSGALTILAERNKELRIASLKALSAGYRLLVPTVAIAESTTGGPRDAIVNRLIKAAIVVDCDIVIARAAAALRFAARAPLLTVDAIVVATADSIPGSIVLTVDLDDLSRLAGVRRLTRIVDLKG
jgi:predicted nucleic acid-binding protein